MEIRLEYGIGREARFLSHLDILRLFGRALRRADLPIAYSQGFNPHPKIAFGPPLAVGMTSEREYLDMELTGHFPLEDLQARLAKAMPRGIVIKDAKEIRHKVPSLMAAIERAEFRLSLPLDEESSNLPWPSLIENFLSRQSIVVTRLGKKGPQPREIRPGIYRVAVEEEQDRLIFNLELQLDNQGTVRPDEVIRGLIDLEKISLNLEQMEICRSGLLIMAGTNKLTPLEVL